jgi:molybdenum cofactor biosynthesis enzyme MoaA
VPHQLIASPYPEGHLVVRPGYDGAVRIGAARYAELRDAPPDAALPSWLAEAARAGWGIDLAGRPAAGTVLVRPETGYGYARASYEVNLGCNYDCEHCYLGEKMFAGMDWPGRERLLKVMADAGVLWLQLTGGEPLIDPLFAETHAAAWDMGMMIQISSNGSRLDRPKTLDLLTARRPYRLTLSLYGATEASYDGMTRRRGSFRRFMRGLAAAHEAGLAMRINIVVSNRNAHEVPAMKAIADRFGIESFEYANISPTIHGGGEVLPSQSREMLRTRKPYTGCNAGITHFHADPHGKASICKVGRDPQVDLVRPGESRGPHVCELVPSLPDASAL